MDHDPTYSSNNHTSTNNSHYNGTTRAHRSTTSTYFLEYPAIHQHHRRHLNAYLSHAKYSNSVLPLDVQHMPPTNDTSDHINRTSTGRQPRPIKPNMHTTTTSSMNTHPTHPSLTPVLFYNVGKVKGGGRLRCEKRHVHGYNLIVFG